jgi:hypothetical protein
VKGNSDGVAYLVPGTSQMLGVSTPVKLVQFLFTQDNTLHTIFFHFAYSEGDSALYDVAELLGQDYSITAEPAARKFRWEPGANTVAQFEIGLSAQQPWAQLAIQTRHAPHELRR